MKVLILDVDKCTGCRSCEVACSAWNTGEVEVNKSCVRVIPFEEEMFYFPSVCQQCDTAFCALACPIGALSRSSETGAVEVDKDRCVGCKICLVACPLGALNIVDTKASKCNLCEGDPKCVSSCGYDALRYGEIDEIGLDKRVSIGDMIKGILSSTAPAKSISVGTIGTKAEVMDPRKLGLRKEAGEK